MMRSRNADYDRINERRNVLFNQFVANLARSIPSTPSSKQRGNKNLSQILSLGLEEKKAERFQNPRAPEPQRAKISRGVRAWILA